MTAHSNPITAITGGPWKLMGPAIAELFLDAGRVYHELGLTPRQLADAYHQRAELLEVLMPLAHIPCERHGNIHCAMLPPDSGVRFCPFCAVRFAISKAQQGET